MGSQHTINIPGTGGYLEFVGNTGKLTVYSSYTVTIRVQSGGSGSYVDVDSFNCNNACVFAQKSRFVANHNQGSYPANSNWQIHLQCDGSCNSNRIVVCSIERCLRSSIGSANLPPQPPPSPPPPSPPPPGGRRRLLYEPQLTPTADQLFYDLVRAVELGDLEDM